VEAGRAIVAVTLPPVDEGGRAPDAWDPARYRRFEDERSQPFFDLLALVHPVPGGEVVDLGCGDGRLTALLHEHCGAARTTGIDTSPSMLREARPRAREGLAFELGDIAGFDAPVDVLFSNAALHWIGDHERLLTRLTGCLRPGGQLAVQVPRNADHASHLVAAEVAAEAPFREAMGGEVPPDPVLGVRAPEAYAELLFSLGFAEQHVRLQVYGHVLPSAADVVEWVRGTTLTRFRSRLPDDLFAAFLARYRERLLARIGVSAPYFYAFKRVLLWGRLGCVALP
jgi:trans-aconitate 2-methyltransferase